MSVMPVCANVMCWDGLGIVLIASARGAWWCACRVLELVCYFRTRFPEDASPVNARVTFSCCVDRLLFYASASRGVLGINFALFLQFAGVMSLLARQVCWVFIEEPKNCKKER